MHRRIYLTALLALAIFAPAAHAATITPIGAWCWFADPRAIDYNGHPVFGWVADDGSIMAGDNTGRRFNLDPRLERDDHDNPAFYIRRDGRLTAFWSRHSGPEMRYRTTTGTSIAEWGPVHTMPANPPAGTSSYTYPNPVRADGTLYLFWSGTNATATYATSQDDGETWSEARNLFDPQAIYVRYIKYRAAGREIHLAWNLAHPRPRKSGIYHAVIRDGKVWRQDGTQIGELGTPLDPTSGDVVYDMATDGHAWIHDIAVKDGKPTIVYATFPTFDDHTYRYARWDGARWQDERITTAGPSFNETLVEAQYSGGITINPQNPTTVYLSRKVAGQFEIERWTRGAVGWTRQAITQRSTEPNVRPFRVGGGLAWMRGRYPSYWQFRTRIEWLPPGAAYPNPVAPRPRVTQPRPRVTPLPARVAPEPPPAVAPGKRGCRLHGRKVSRRGVSCVRARRVLRRYLRAGQARHGWRCRAHGRVVCKRHRARVSVAS